VQPAPAVRAVVVSWNGADLLPSCLDPLEAQTVRDDMEVVVVDNASSDDTQELLIHLFANGIVIRADINHLTEAYSKSLAPLLGEALGIKR
jgi:N-acetylglucosaminyl-diphospho-decaprenol L-rhamnosyltransferase